MYKGELLGVCSKQRRNARKGIDEVAASCLRCLRGSCPWHATDREHGLRMPLQVLAVPRRC